MKPTSYVTPTVEYAAERERQATRRATLNRRAGAVFIVFGFVWALLGVTLAFFWSTPHPWVILACGVSAALSGFACRETARTWGYSADMWRDLQRRLAKYGS